MKYRKKPVIIEAFWWTGGSDQPEDPAWIVDALKSGRVVIRKDDPYYGLCMYISTLEGDMVARVGDWIINGVKGELYPCKPDIFAATYEPVVAG